MGVLARAYTLAGSGLQLVLSRVFQGTTGDVPATFPMGGQLDFGGSATGNLLDKVSSSSNGTYTAEITCDGYANVVLHAEFENSAGKITLTPIVGDANATPAWSHDTIFAIQADAKKHATEEPGLVSSAWYNGPRAVIPTYGAKRMKFLIGAITGGQRVSLYASKS
jgi:hypothetical protein